MYGPVPLTPVPLEEPPAGVAPPNVNAASELHTPELAGQLIVGSGFTVKVAGKLVALRQPLTTLAT